MEYQFEVEGSKGDLYEVMFLINNNELTGRCTCRAGQSKTLCKHLLSKINPETSEEIEFIQAIKDTDTYDVISNFFENFNAQKNQDKYFKLPKNIKRHINKQEEVDEILIDGGYLMFIYNLRTTYVFDMNKKCLGKVENNDLNFSNYHSKFHFILNKLNAEFFFLPDSEVAKDINNDFDNRRNKAILSYHIFS
ncbi:hypothetical protein FLK61_25990 [Paenalkalicoccus suaedae]|uniref:SWIM-type domain-containing protein n=1 Tax=Paenalkalicoccus suaedae TaxID=2592382 RepID=A0A859FD91_9BACI|nr:SWIM zinc finger family protein [Paenalkalicoccus suaedae]QKS70215.1 hypothetical protein FLK61_25990 [Paenalkalicoccus suaedae]